MPNNLTRKRGDWGAFIRVLGETSNVSAACRAAQVKRTSAYERREAHPAFAAAWDECIETAVDDLEGEAWRRTKTSDTLAIFLLKAHRPSKYRETVQQQHSGEVKHTVVLEGFIREKHAEARST